MPRQEQRIAFYVDLWVGNAAAVWNRCCGGVSPRSQETGLSRTTIYKHAQRVEEAMLNEASGGVSYETLWADNQRLGEENEALWETWSESEGVSEAKQREFAATGSAIGLSLDQIVALLAMVWCLSHGVPWQKPSKWILMNENINC